MKKALFVDCCLRENSRTKVLANSFITELNDYEIDHLILEKENLKPLVGEFYSSREQLLANKDLSHPRFNYAYQFKDADLIIMAAPFWDLSFPSLLKIYIENISVEGITFSTTENGLQGLCKANNLVYLTTRGGIYGDNNPLEQAIPYIEALTKFFGIDNLHYVYADGMDIVGYNNKKSLDDAIKRARDLAKTL